MSFLLEGDSSRRQSREEALAEVPDDLKAVLLERLKSADLLTWIISGIAAMGVAGEQRLALTLFLVGISRLLANPLAVILQGPSSSGKSYVLEQVAGLFPPEAVLLATDITPNALYYLPPGELAHRFVIAGERPRRPNDESAEATKALRELLSAGRLSKMVPNSDSDGRRTERFQQQGPIAYAESTTATDLFDEDANRCLVLQPDDRPEQTATILQASALRLAGYGGPDRDQLRTKFHALQRLLEPCPLVIPYAQNLARLFTRDRLEVRKAFGQVTSLIQANALLHQYQRPRDDQARLIAQPQDYWLARQLLSDVLARSLGEQPADGLRRFVEQLQSLQLSGEYTTAEVAKLCRRNERTVREHLQELLKLSRIEQTQAARGPLPARWLIRANISLDDDAADLLPTVVDVCE